MLQKFITIAEIVRSASLPAKEFWKLLYPLKPRIVGAASSVAPTCVVTNLYSASFL